MHGSTVAKHHSYISRADGGKPRDLTPEAVPPPLRHRGLFPVKWVGKSIGLKS